MELIRNESDSDFWNISLETDSKSLDLPIDMTFNDGHLLSIIVYSILLVIGIVGNTTVIVVIYKYRRFPRINRINLLLLHLAVADLLVAFLLMPLEIGWASTVSWTAGDLACRGLSFFRTFGLYLSGFILVCISLDRYFAVVKPLAVPEAHLRGRIMLKGAWIGSFICSIPQVVIFHVEKHPDFPWYEQCVTFNAFSSQSVELAYNIFGFIGMYGFPLVMIIFSYGSILYEITKVNKIFVDGEEIRRSNITRMGKAKVRTLKLTILIVFTFCLCWTPYNIMSIWYWIDKNSASQVDQRVQKGFFLFAVTNSCFNPLVYGLFNIRRRNPGPQAIQPGNLRHPLYRMPGQQYNRVCIRRNLEIPSIKLKEKDSLSLEVDSSKISRIEIGNHILKLPIATTPYFFNSLPTILVPTKSVSWNNLSVPKSMAPRTSTTDNQLVEKHCSFIHERVEGAFTDYLSIPNLTNKGSTFHYSLIPSKPLYITMRKVLSESDLAYFN